MVVDISTPGRWPRLPIPAGLKCQGAAPPLRTHPLLAHTESLCAYVGGGLSSIEASKIAIKTGRSPIILERDCFLGGIWCTSANLESRVQVDPVSFRDVHDTSAIRTPSDDDPFDNMYTTRDEMLGRFERDVAEHRLRERTVFNCHVARFEALPSGLVRVYLRPVVSEAEEEGEFYRDFKELHIRTGSLTDHLGSHAYPGQGEFDGVVAKGVGGDVSLDDLRGKRVVIVGFGAFAVENVRRCMMAGAASVTLLTRKKNKLLFPASATYLMRNRLQSDDALSDKSLVSIWGDVIRLIKAGAEAAGLEDIIMSDECVCSVEGVTHLLFNNGLPSLCSDQTLLFHAYGLLDVHVDEVTSLLPGREVLTREGRTLPCDVLLRCVGFGTNEKLFDGHVVNDSFFIDGKANITHNLRGDRINGSNITGPKVNCANFLISYYEDAQEYERCFLRLIESDKAFSAMFHATPARNYGLIQSVDYFTTLQLSDKLYDLEDEGIQAILDDNKGVRRKLYKDLLPKAEFFRRNRAEWEKLSAHLATMTGRPVVPYPFDIV